MTNEPAPANELALYFKSEDIAALLDYKPDLIVLRLSLINNLSGTSGTAMAIAAQGVDTQGASIGNPVNPCPYPCRP